MTTFYVRASGGNDASSGLNFLNAWATLQKAADTLVAGDTVLIVSDGTHLPTAIVDLDTNAGTVIAPIKWRGAGPLGQDDGSIATINGFLIGGFAPRIFETGADNSTDHIWWEGLNITTCANLFVCDTDQRGWFFNKCRFHNSTGDCFLCNKQDFTVVFANCEIDNNGGVGVSSQGVGKTAFLSFINCSIHDNDSHGIRTGNHLVMHNCWVYKNGGDGVRSTSASVDGFAVIHNCVFDENASDGITMLSTPDTGRGSFINNIISNNGGWGITFDDGLYAGLHGHNLYYNNTLGDVSFDGSSEDSLDAFDNLGGSITGDPLYADTTDGNEDYRIASGSPAFGIGYPQAFPNDDENFPHIGSNVPKAGGCIISG